MKFRLEIIVICVYFLLSFSILCCTKKNCAFVGGVLKTFTCNIPDSEGSVTLTHYQNNNEPLVILTAVNVLRVSLKVAKTLKFDENSILECNVLSNTLTVTNETEKICIQNRIKKPPAPPSYEYEEGTTVTFNCSRKENKHYNSMHWVRANDKNVVQTLLNQYDYANLTYTENLTREHNGSKLVCIHFKCENYPQTRTISCERKILNEIDLKLATIEEFKNDLASDSRNAVLIGGVSGLFVIILTSIIAFVLYLKWKRRKKMSASVQYIEVEFSEMSSSPTTAPLKQDETVYSEVIGMRSFENIIGQPT